MGMIGVLLGVREWTLKNTKFPLVSGQEKRAVSENSLFEKSTLRFENFVRDFNGSTFLKFRPLGFRLNPLFWTPKWTPF